MKPLINPFLTIGYQGPDYFCDREEETILLTNLLQGGLHVSLFAIRRLGKTGLIHHVFNSFTENDKLICIYLDILSTKNLMDFSQKNLWIGSLSLRNRFKGKISNLCIFIIL